MENRSPVSSGSASSIWPACNPDSSLAFSRLSLAAYWTSHLSHKRVSLVSGHIGAEWSRGRTSALVDTDVTIGALIGIPAFDGTPCSSLSLLHEFGHLGHCRPLGGPCRLVVTPAVRHLDKHPISQWVQQPWHQRRQTHRYPLEYQCLHHITYGAHPQTHPCPSGYGVDHLDR